MSKLNLSGFGEIDINNLEEYYNSEMNINGRQVEVDVNFEDVSIDKSKIDKINVWLSNLPSLDKLGVDTIKEDFKTGETVREYIEHHLEELDSGDIKKLLKGANKELTKEEKMLTAIKLKRVGFYPHTEERFINLDYSLDEDLTDYLVVLDFTEDGKLHYITLES